MGLRRRRVDETVGSAIVPGPGEVTGWGGQPAGWEATGLLGPSVDLLSPNILQPLITSGRASITSSSCDRGQRPGLWKAVPTSVLKSSKEYPGT